MPSVACLMIRQPRSFRWYSISKYLRPDVRVWSATSAPVQLNVIVVPDRVSEVIAAVGAVWSVCSVNTMELNVPPLAGR